MTARPVAAGQVLQTFLLPLEPGKIREFATAIGEDNPVFFSTRAFTDPEYRMTLPLTFVQISSFYAAGGSASRVLGLDYRSLLHGEQAFAYKKPVYAGQLLRATQTLADRYRKPGKRGGTMEFFIIDTEYRDEAGDVAIVARQTLIQVGGPA